MLPDESAYKVEDCKKKLTFETFVDFQASIASRPTCNKSPYEGEFIIFCESTCEILGINYLCHVHNITIGTARERRVHSISIMCILFLVMSQNRLFIIFNLYVVSYLNNFSLRFFFFNRSLVIVIE